MTEVLYYVAAALVLTSVLLLWGAARAVRRGQWAGSVGRTGSGALLLSLAALAGTLGISTHGYRALVFEEVAATITTEPVGPAAFDALVTFPDGRTATFRVLGDQLLVDAHILKWHPIANLLGVHTHYELDRLAGRYLEIEDERQRPRTVHSLKVDKPADLFHLARRYTFLSFLVDTEYGSATFIQVDRPARFEVRVSTTGLLIRELQEG